MPIQDSLPKSRITLTYRTTINGEPETVKLPLRLLILGDFSKNTSVDRFKTKQPKQKMKKEGDKDVPDMGADGKTPQYEKEADGVTFQYKYDEPVDMGARPLRSVTGNNLNSVMKDMRIALNLDDVRNWLSPDDEDAKLPIRNLPITGMRSFDPDHIVENVPQLKGLQQLRTLLEEIQSKIDNTKELRKTIQNAYEKGSRKKLLEAITGTEDAKKAEFKGLELPKLPASTSTGTASDTPPPTDSPAGSTPPDVLLTNIFTSVKSARAPEDKRKPLITKERTVVELESKLEETEKDAIRLESSLVALLSNVQGLENTGPDKKDKPYRFDKGQVMKAIERVNEVLNLQVNAILHSPTFQSLEATWRGLADLVENTNFKADITIDLLDVEKSELRDDFENNSSDIFSGELFEKVYIKEYDQFGGRPFGAMIGLYEFDSTKQDLDWLQRMGKLANAAHCPFISAVSPKFFDGGYEGAEKVEALKDLNGHLAQPKFSKWNKLRDTEEGAYLGLTFPRYALRLPWHPEKNPCDKLPDFEEDTRQDNKLKMLARYDAEDLKEIKELEAQGMSSPDDPRKKPEKDTRLVDSRKYLWGNSAILFARNLVKAFEIAGWCQAIRGPKGGGLITGLPVDTFKLRGQDEILPPVEIAIPDYREFEFANNGFMPLVYRKSSGDACFFSTQAIKVSKKFKDPKDQENSQLVTNLAYTFSITRLAHYIKCIMRDNIGSTADDVYIQQQLQSWLAGYVTTVANPDDLTVRRFPFKAATVEVTSKPGEIGWYDCKVAVLPHIQFEGLNVTLMLESRLGAAK